MHFFLQFVDFFALFLVFFGLAFFLLRRFFQWYLSIPALIEGQQKLESEIKRLSAQVNRLIGDVEQVLEDNPLADSAATKRLQQVAQETLNAQPKGAKNLEQDFRAVDPQVRAEVQKRQETGLCVYCGQPLQGAELFCSLAHQADYFKGSVVEPLNLPFQLD